MTPIIPSSQLPFSATVTADGSGVLWSGQFGRSETSGQILLNSTLLYSDLTKVSAGKAPDGSAAALNLLDEFATQYGLKKELIDSDTFWSIQLLHELGHQGRGFADDTGDRPQSETNTGSVIQNCMPWLKQ